MKAKKPSCIFVCLLVLQKQRERKTKPNEIKKKYTLKVGVPRDLSKRT